MYLRVCRSFTFDAAHRLPNYDGACANLHGHQWKLEVEVGGEPDAVTGMVIDFCKIKRAVDAKIISQMDHSYLNDEIGNPTAETLVEMFVNQLKEVFDLGLGLQLTKVRLYETPNSYCEWRL